MGETRQFLKNLVRVRKNGETIQTKKGIYIIVEKPTKKQRNLMQALNAQLCVIKDERYLYMIPFWVLDVIEEVLNEDKGDNMGRHRP